MHASGKVTVRIVLRNFKLPPIMLTYVAYYTVAICMLLYYRINLILLYNTII